MSLQTSSQIEAQHVVGIEKRDERGALVVQISNAIVRLHATQYGRGPTKARTVIQGDVIVCVLEDIFTPAERTLVESGRPDQVREIRTAFQDAMRDQFTEIVEEITGRRVRGFFSQVDSQVNAAVEVFLMDAPPLGSVDTPISHSSNGR